MTEIEKYYNILFVIFGRISIGTMLLPIVMALWNKKYLNKPLKIFLLYCIATFLINFLEQFFIWVIDNYTDLLVPYLNKWHISDTSFLQILYYLKDFAFLGWFYSLLLSLKYGIWGKGISTLLFITALTNYFFIEGYNVYGVFNPAADAIFCFVLPAFYLWYLFRHMLHFPINKNPYFWISFGLVFTNLIGLFLYLTGGTIYGDDFVLFAKISIARNGFDIISQILLAIGFWHAPYAKYLPLPNEKVTTI